MPPGFSFGRFISTPSRFFYLLHPDNERLQPWDVLCRFFKSSRASALGLKWLCSASFCSLRKFIYFFTFPPQITVADAKVTEPNGHKHSWGKWKTWQMAIWQPEMDAFLWEHILRGCREIQKNKTKQKMNGNTDNHWEWPHRLALSSISMSLTPVIKVRLLLACWLSDILQRDITYLEVFIFIEEFCILHIRRRRALLQTIGWTETNAGHRLMPTPLHTQEGTDVCDNMKNN